jgi:ribosomal protein S21
MPDEQSEQLDVNVVERPVEDVAEQPEEDVAVESEQDVAEDVTQDVAESEVTDLRELLARDDGIDQLLSNEELGRTLKGRIEKEQKDAEMRGRQAYEKEMRLRAADDQQIASWQDRYLERIGVNQRDMSVEDKSELLAMLDARGDYKWLSKLRGLNEDVVRFLGADNPEMQAAFNATFDSYGEDQEAWQKATNTIAGALHAKGKREGESEFKEALKGKSPAELRTDPDMVALFEKWKEAEDETERQTREREGVQRNVNPGPAATKGSPPAGAETFATMTADQLANLPEEEYERAKKAILGVS